MNDIEELEIRILTVQDSMNDCKIMGDMLGFEYYRGLMVGLEEKLDLLKSINKK